LCPSKIHKLTQLMVLSGGAFGSSPRMNGISAFTKEMPNASLLLVDVRTQQEATTHERENQTSPATRSSTSQTAEL
jgi:hypothetical protein